MTELPMQGKVCLITGATDGIGRVTARELAALGATTVLVGRNETKCQTTADLIMQQTGNSNVRYLVADLAVTRQVRELAARFQNDYDRLDVLVNNVGGIFIQRQESSEGIEMTLALNHLSYFVLTTALCDMLCASAPARVVNVASKAHEGARINFDDLQGRRVYNGLSAYGASKLANVLFTYELDRRWQGRGVSVNALHPGVVATSFGLNNGMFALFFRRFFFDQFAVTPEEGARTSVYLASSPEVSGISGQYFEKQRPVRSAPASYDEAAARRLWEVSEALVSNLIAS